MALALRVLSNEWEAEEVVQDVFLALWLKPPELSNGMTSLIAWLVIATKRQCWLRLRRSKRRPPSEGLSDELGYSDPVFDRVGEILVRQKFEAALPRVKPRHREILMLVYYDNLEPTEVANRLKMPVVTVRKWLATATLRLRRLFAVACG
jgi:RNA polymerase sigma-70 factor (ECF subfamily)